MFMGVTVPAATDSRADSTDSAHDASPRAVRLDALRLATLSRSADLRTWRRAIADDCLATLEVSGRTRLTNG
jgi:hypothetical protein